MIKALMCVLQLRQRGALDSLTIRQALVAPRPRSGVTRARAAAACGRLLSYAPLLVCALWCTESTARTFFPYQISSPGDQSTARLRVSNLGSVPREFKLGPRDGQRATQTLVAYESRDYLVQCLRRNDTQLIPELEFTLGKRDQSFDPWITHESDPLRIVWNRGAPQNSNRLKWPLRSLLMQMYHQKPRVTRSDSFLSEISAWSHTQLFMTSLKALSDLKPHQRFTIKMMVAMGVTLVIGTGDVEGEEQLLQEFVAVGLGEVKSSEGALLELLPRASSYRRLFARSGVYPLVIADGEPIALESEFGLGRVRVVAVRLNEITRGEVARQLFKSDLRAKHQLREWLDLSMPPISAPHRLLHDRVWLLIIIIPLIFLLSRREWKLIALGSVVWVTIALIRPPLFAPTSIRQANLLYIPMRTNDAQEGAIVFGQIDLNSFDRGGRVQRFNRSHVSLISAETQGACLMHTLHDADAQNDPKKTQAQANSQRFTWLVLESDIGERQRFKYIGYVPQMPNRDGSSPSITMPRWPAGPWSGATLTPLSVTARDMILTADLSGVRAWQITEREVHAHPTPLRFTRTRDDEL